LAFSIGWVECIWDMAILTHRPGVLENLQGLLLRVERRSNDEDVPLWDLPLYN